MTHHSNEIPADIQSNIKGAWIAGTVSIIITLIFIGLSFQVPEIAAMGINVWALVDVAIMAGLTFGVYRKSRAAAVGLFGFFLLNKLVMLAQTGQFSGGFLSIIFLILYGRGIKGPFDYHKWLSQQDNVPAPAEHS